MLKKSKNYHEKYNGFYQTSEWKALRAARFVHANGLCERCKQFGKTVAGKEVHHIIPIEENWGKRLDFENTILLCSDCHNIQHSRISPLQKFNLLWEGLDNGRSSSDDKTE